MSDFVAGKCGQATYAIPRSLICGENGHVCKWCKRILELEEQADKLEADLAALREQTRWRLLEEERPEEIWGHEVLCLKAFQWSVRFTGDVKAFNTTFWQPLTLPAGPEDE